MRNINCIFGTNTSLIEASRLLVYGDKTDADCDWGKTKNTAIRRLLEFCNVVESVVLNETIYLLPCVYPQDIDLLELFIELKREGICKEFEDTELSEQNLSFAHQLIGDLGNNRIYQKAQSSIQKTGNMLEIGDSERVLLDIEHMSNFWKGKSEKSLTDLSLDDFLLFFNSHLHGFLSPANDYVVHQIRNILYWIIADQFKISYLPDTFRIEWINQLTSKWRNTLSQVVYSHVAEIFLASIMEIIVEEEPLEILLPPIPALVLEKVTSTSEVIESLLELREQFSTLRQSFSDLEDSLRNARTIAERRSCKNKIKKMFEAVSKKYNNSDKTTLTSAIGYTNDLLKVIKKPLEPESYTTFLKPGSEWLRTWWNSRPLNRLFSVTKKVERLPGYFHIAKFILGRDIQEYEIKSFMELYNRSLNIRRWSLTSRVE